MKKSLAALLPLACVLSLAAEAQPVGNRNILIAPVLDTAADGRLVRFPVPRFAIEAGRGWHSAKDEQAWNIKLVGSFQIEVGDGRTVLLGLFSNEMTTNPYNDISFNPRGSTWNENAFVARRFSHGSAHFGILFRSRHDLDNKDGYDEEIPDSLDVPLARVVGLGGLQLGYTSNERRFAGRWQLRYSARAEGYFHTKDSRSPNVRISPDWTDAISMGAVALRVSRPIRAGVRGYVRGWAMTHVFKPDAGMFAKTNARAEIGIRGFSTPAGMDLHVAYERWFDDLSRPMPQKNKAWIAGLRISADEMF